MALIMTEISPKTPNGIAKISIEAEDIITEADFEAELDLAGGIPAQRPVESRDFAQVGQILRKMLQLEVQTEGTIVQPPSIDVEVPVEVPAVEGGTPEVPQQLVPAETSVRAIILSTEIADSAPQNVLIGPLEFAANSQILRAVPTPNVSELGSTSKTPSEIKFAGDPQIVVQPDGKVPESKFDSKPPLAQPETITQRPAAEVSRDIASTKPSETKLQFSGELQTDVGNFGLVISDKLQTQRPLQSIISATQPNPVQPQTAEAKVVLQISTVISNTSKGTVEIRLDPPELGRVIISITQSDSGLSATIISEKPEISDLLRRHAELLSRELSKSGFSETSLEFSHRDQQQERSAFEDGKVRFPQFSPEHVEETSAREIILQSQSGSLDIRL